MRISKLLEISEVTLEYRESAAPLGVRINPLLFLLGTCVVTASLEDAAEVLNVCMSNGIVCRGQRVICGEEGTERLCICLTVRGYARLKRLWEEADGVHFPLVLERCYGLPSLVLQNRTRAGAMLGFLLACTIIWISGQVLWDVRVTGNDAVPSDVIKAQLRECGFDIGAVLSGIDTDRIENELLLRSDDISWMSINIRGTVAHVEVREKQIEPPKEVRLPANLVAAKNGEIVRLEVYSGLPMVSVGSIVSRGELLVSGIYDSKSVGYRLRSASGSVFAKTNDTVIIEIPLEYEVKSYTGVDYEEKSLKIFGKTIKISKNSRNLPTLCDKIIRVDNLTLVEGKLIPCELSVTQYREYEWCVMRRSAEEATELAFDELTKHLLELGEDTFLLRKSISTEITDVSVRIVAELSLIENIAKRQEFEFVRYPQQ